MPKQYICKVILAVMAMMSVASCTHTELPRIGRTIDADTKRPIGEVVVNLNIGTGYFPWATGGQSYSYETISDENGDYHMPMSFRWMGFLEFVTTHELYFHKSGYYAARVLRPSIRNDIELYKVKYLSDYYSYINSAKENGGLYFIQKHKDNALKLQEELIKTASTKTINKGEPAFFSEIPGATLTNILCGRSTSMNPVSDGNYTTYETVGITCAVYDMTSQKWFGLKPQGQYFDYSDKMPNVGKMLVQEDFRYFSFADHTSIYGYDNFGIPSSDKSKYKRIEPMKGNISAATGVSNTVITIEDNGKSICRYFFSKGSFLTNSCVSVPSIKNSYDAESSNIMLFLSKFHNNSSYEFYGISKTKYNYILYKIKERDEAGHWIMSMDEYARIPIDDELIGYYSLGNLNYLQFTKSGLRKFNFSNINKSIETSHVELQKFASQKQVYGEDLVSHEDIEFSKMIRNLSFSNKITDFAVGPSAGQDLLYIVTSDSKIYRVMPDGSPDYIIDVK